MSSWLDEYIRTLELRDSREKLNQDLTTACKLLYSLLPPRHNLSPRKTRQKILIYGVDTTLAEYAASLHRKESIAGSAKAQTTTTAAGSPKRSQPPAATGSPSTKGSTSDIDIILTSLRADLTAANRTTASLTAQLESAKADISRLQSASSAQRAQQAVLEGQIRTLETERNALGRKLRDRESELREKARLVEGVQDEMLGLEMQVNVAEARVKKVEGENRELVERWRRRVGSEAEEMNKGSGWE